MRADAGADMVMTVVTFDLPSAVERDEILRRFHAILPDVARRPGLVTKHFLVSPDRRTVGGAYLWKSAADATFDAAWREDAERVWGAPPRVQWFDVPLSAGAPLASRDRTHTNQEIAAPLPRVP
jgi:hypothetical protein